MPDNPNPQGKGLVPILEAWQSTRPTQSAPKQPRQVLSDYAISLLVLSAKFQFKPLPEKTYYLYWQHPQFKLSLIAPQQWPAERSGEFVGRCRMALDLTWQVEASAAPYSAQLSDAIASFMEQFQERLQQDQPLEDGLPYYAEQLPFYARLLATGLATSLKSSMAQAGLLQKPSQFWLEAQPATPGTDGVR